MESKSGLRWLVLVLVVAAGGVVALRGGCSEVSQAIDNTAEAVTGNQAVKKGNMVKSEFRRISAEHNRKIEEAMGRD